MQQRRHLNGEAFERRREELGSPWLAVFVADWCEPCTTLLSRLSGARQDSVRNLPVGIVDVEREPELAERYGARGIPTLVLFVEGEPRLTRVGALSAEQLQQLCEEAGRA